MKNQFIFMAVSVFIAGCVPTSKYRHAVLENYKKGLSVGRVIGRDEVLSELKSKDCFIQPVDELMVNEKETRK